MVKATSSLKKSKPTTIAKKLKQHALDLQCLNKAKGNVQKAIIKNSKPSLVKVLVLLAGNILNGVVELTPKQKIQLRNYANVIRNLVNGVRSTTARKQLVTKYTNQQGGFLSFLIKPIAGLIKGLIGN